MAQHELAAMLDAITLEEPEWLASESSDADLATSARIAESYSRQKETRLKIAKDAATEAARRAVFATGELVDNIVVHLPVETIFEVQRVSKGFRDGIATSPSIREKVFLSKRDDPATRSIVDGGQYTAAILNPLFELSGRMANGYCYIVPLLVENSLGRGLRDDFSGVAIARPTQVTLDSSIMDTFLLDKPLPIRRAYLEIRLGKNGPYIFVDRDNISVGEDWTLRDIVREVLSNKCHLLVMSTRAAKSYRRTNAQRRTSPIELDTARRAPNAVSSTIDALEDALEGYATNVA